MSVHKPTRSEVCSAYLEAAEEMCRESESLTAAIDDVQSQLWMELAAWNELLDDVCSLESRLHALVVLASRPAGDAAPRTPSRRPDSWHHGWVA